MSSNLCPFRIGDQVVFSPPKRTTGLYQDIERFGVKVGHSYRIADIKDGTYLYFDSGKGGWPWTEFTAVKSANSRARGAKSRH
jgi:hypothetical protein